jgi:ppGpp synthetase/RelA/SpoT-type nucleotidyltranferase
VSVRAYANRLKAKWRQGVRNLLKHEEVLYNIAWAGLRNSLKNKVGSMTPASGRFERLDQFFDKATVSDLTHVKIKKPPQQQQQQQQQQQKQPMDSSSKCGK